MITSQLLCSVIVLYIYRIYVFVLELCLKFAYHDTIIRISQYTLGINTSNVHMINNLHKTARMPFMLRCMRLGFNLKYDYKSPTM